MKKVYEDEWLIIDEQKPKPKTKVFGVHSKCSKCTLGWIKWHGPWRHYCFFPDDWKKLVFSDRCMIAIGEFITTQNKEHKNGK